MTDRLLPVTEIARRLDIPDNALLPYGPDFAKLKLDLLDGGRPDRGKLILVTAMTPTSHGEGKTVVSIGLTQGIAKLGKRAVATLREPSLGPVFGLKGGATGGGRAKVLPAERINLHFTGDFHAITSAHNLLAAAVDSQLHFGNETRLDVDSVSWPRAMDMNDRALRHVIVGLGGKANGVPRETGFVITAASEIMAILALASSPSDLRHRLDDIVVGFGLDGGAVRARSLGVTGSMMVLLRDALMPNLAQTSEHAPAIVHAGPFANIAHGTSSVLAQRMGLKLADYVVNECGFGADLGAEKYFDIVMPSSGLRPSAAVLVATVKALEAHGGGDVERGLANLERHLTNLRKFGVPVVVAVNRFPSDTPAGLAAVERFCERERVECATADVFERGGEGALDLAAKVVAAADSASGPGARSLYPLDLGLVEKIETVAREIYGARAVNVEAAARKKLRRFEELGFGRYPICMAKTPASFSDDPKRLGAPSDWTMTVSDAHLSAGAGFVVAVAGSMMLMPGLPKDAQATHIDLDDDGNVVGMH
jgi:formate--tetrahydrofolate ligase